MCYFTANLCGTIKWDPNIDFVHFSVVSMSGSEFLKKRFLQTARGTSHSIDAELDYGTDHDFKNIFLLN